MELHRTSSKFAPTLVPSLWGFDFYSCWELYKRSMKLFIMKFKLQSLKCWWKSSLSFSILRVISLSHMYIHIYKYIHQSYANNHQVLYLAADRTSCRSRSCEIWLFLPDSKGALHSCTSWSFSIESKSELRLWQGGHINNTSCDVCSLNIGGKYLQQ